MRTVDREKPLPQNSAVSRQVFALLGQHLYSEFFQLVILYGPTSETVRIQRRQKRWLK